MPARHALLGMDVFSKDGSRIIDARSVVFLRLPEDAEQALSIYRSPDND
jgi:hypothetical protein